MARRGDQLLGRDAEFTALRAALDDAIGGHSRFVVVSGEAGIGKSHLLEALTVDARGAHCLTLTGRAAEFEADVPFAVLIDAVDSYLRTLDQQDVDRLWADRLGALAAVFPALEGLGPAVDIPVNAAERFRVHRAVGELIERLAARQPVLLVLDDLQWADAASLELAAHLTRRPPHGAVLIAFGVRSGTAPEHAQRSLASIETANHVVSVAVKPLDRLALGALVGISDPTDAERWYQLTRGNPFYALQLSRAGLGPVNEFDLEDVPDAVQRAIRVEFEALPEVARGVAAAAAVVGDPFDLDLVINASEKAEDELLAGLDHLCAGGIVHPTSTPRIFEFRHPLVRSAIYQVTLPGARIAYHRQIAEHLKEREASPVEQARHVEFSARHGDLDAVEVLGQAAEAVLAHAPASAVRWLTTALALLPASEPPHRRIRLLGQLANAHAALGDLASGLVALRNSLTLVPADDHLVLARRAIACSVGERLTGQPDVAAATLRDAYERVHDRGSVEAVLLSVARSTNAVYLGAFDDALKWADEAVRVAENLGDQELIVAARSVKFAGAAFSGRITGARELHAELRPVLDDLGDDAFVRQLDVLGALASGELYLDLYHDAYAHATRGLAIARRTGRAHLVPIFISTAGTAAWMSGEIDVAVEIYDDALEGARALDNEAVLAWHLFNRALPELALGDLDHAVHLSGESWALAEKLPPGLIRGLSAATRASALQETRRPAEAIELLYGGAGGPDLSLIGGAWRGVWFEIAIRCHLELGDIAAAQDAVKRAHALAEAVPVDLAMMTAERSEAAVALEMGHADHAVALLRSALTRAETVRSPVYIAWCEELLGLALEAAGDRKAAVQHLATASTMSDELGAMRHRDRIDADLRRLGETVHRRTRRGARGVGGIAALTGRELEVAELIGINATNREIANDLFLSQKTVETHIRNIFNKLGVTSRAEITRALTATQPS